MNLYDLKRKFKEICCGCTDHIYERQLTVKVAYNGKMYDIDYVDLKEHGIVVISLDEGIKKWETPGRPKMTQGSYPTYY